MVNIVLISSCVPRLQKTWILSRLGGYLKLVIRWELDLIFRLYHQLPLSHNSEWRQEDQPRGVSHHGQHEDQLGDKSEDILDGAQCVYFVGHSLYFKIYIKIRKFPVVLSL